jgi:hypothetical protein
VIERAACERDDESVLQFESLALAIFPVEEFFDVEFRNESRSHRRFF